MAYICKESAYEDLTKAISGVMNGGTYFSEMTIQKLKKSGGLLDVLSSRELQVLKCLVEAKHMDSIARELEISVKTVETHRANVCKKLKVFHLIDLTKLAIREGLIGIDSNLLIND